MPATPKNCRIRPIEPSWLARHPRHGRAVVIDQVAIDQALAGPPGDTHLTPLEKREAARQAIARGWAPTEVAHQLRLSGLTLQVALAEDLPAVDEPIAWWPTEEQLRLQPA